MCAADAVRTGAVAYGWGKGVFVHFSEDDITDAANDTST